MSGADVVLAHGLQEQLQVLAEIAKGEELDDLPERPLDKNARGRVRAVERFLCGDEIGALKPSPHVAEQGVRAVAVDLLLLGSVRVLH